ncbi:MAG: ADP-ribosylglycohydrolase family protein [Olsenella sp.]|nr:ADP-ribosylglycohydrolase family protein [Olsenella sp.]
MTGFGTHHQEPGTWSDDTSLTLAACDSIRRSGRFDAADTLAAFRSWLNDGAYSPDGVAFDVGNTCRAAITRGVGGSGEWDNGNGSLMRIAPMALLDCTDAEVRESSAITHAHEVSCNACVEFVGLVREALADPAATLDALRTSEGGRPREEIGSSGFVLHTLGAARWCVGTSATYAEAVLKAVNLGEDTDTTAAVTGALAAAIWGASAIPAEWLGALRARDLIESCLF